LLFEPRIRTGIDFRRSRLRDRQQSTKIHLKLGISDQERILQTFSVVPSCPCQSRIENMLRGFGGSNNKAPRRRAFVGRYLRQLDALHFARPRHVTPTFARIRQPGRLCARNSGACSLVRGLALAEMHRCISRSPAPIL